MVGYDYGGEPINIAYQFSVFWNQATVLIHSCPHVIHRVNVCTKGDILAVNMWIFVVNWVFSLSTPFVWGFGVDS